MSIILYHGSENIIEHPTYGKGARNNDYGRGFYCTEQLELAKEWACAKGTNGFANKYELNTKNLIILNLNQKPYHILNWLAVLADNRTYWQNSSISEDAKQYIKMNFLPNITPYDIIIGYRADDSYFSFAQDFVSGTISLQKLKEAMYLGNLGEQIVLKSQKSFEQITYLGNESADAEEYYVKKTARERDARRQYRKNKKGTSYVNEIYILDIMREEMKNNDPRLF